MEQFVLGAFQEQLSKIIVGFRKEQVTANLLNGKGEITDISLNCSVFNESIASITPYIEFESIHVSKLSFHVTSWTNLRKAPIVIDMEHITVVIHEPLRYLDKEYRKSIRIVTEQELIQMIVQGIYKSTRSTTSSGFGDATTKGGGSGTNTSSSSSSSTQQHHQQQQPYGFLDRIIDNLSIELKHVTIQYQTWGKFKTKRIGIWTPPCLQIQLKYLKIVSVDEYGVEGSPEQVWAHNRHVHDIFHLYKKISMEIQISLLLLLPHQQQQQQQSSTSTTTSSTSSSEYPQQNQQSSSSTRIEIPLLKATGIECQIVTQRRLRDGAVLSIQLDTTLDRVEIDLESNVIPLLAQLVSGFQYCVAKDRTFEDPLKVLTQEELESGTVRRRNNNNNSNGMESMSMSIGGSSSNDSLGIVTDDDEDEEYNDLDSNDGDGDGRNSIDLNMIEIDDDAQSVDSADVDEPSEIPSSSSSPAITTTKTTTTTTQTNVTSSNNNNNNASSSSNRPLIMLPTGLIIWGNICITLSIHHVTIRGSYPSKDNGYVQLLSKGIIAEFIWPKEDTTSSSYSYNTTNTNMDMGCYCQLSLAYISIQERKEQRIRTILMGGMQHGGDSHDYHHHHGNSNGNNGPLETPTILPREVKADENFPFFERRPIRDDPLGLRYSFPSQAFGVKTTIDFISKDTTTTTTDSRDSDDSTNQKVIMVTHEIGIDKFDIIFDSDAWCRAIRFILNEDGGGFDPRWHSGDWSYYLTRDMLQQPNLPLDLDRHLQPVKQVFLDENLMISSELLNVTARLTSVEIRIPASIHENARSCDVIIKFDETMFIVSSALPRTFLSGKIGNSINNVNDNFNDDGPPVTIDFPNDPSDIAYSVGHGTNPSVTTKPLSTFRVQVTMRGFAISINPVIPYCRAPEPQQLIAPSDCNMIVCFEGEPPEPGSTYIKIVLFLSIEFHSFRMNLDLDLLAGATSTLLYHSEVVKTTLETAKEIVADAASSHPVASSSNNLSPPSKVKKSLRGRRVMVRRQLSRSRETGGLSIIFGMKLSNFEIVLWRQNVPFFSPLRQVDGNIHNDNDDANPQSKVDEASMMKLLKLIELSMNNFETGIEFAFHADQTRRVVLKCCLGQGNLKVCDLDTSLEEYEAMIFNSFVQSIEDPDQDCPTDDDHTNQNIGQSMVNVLSFGVENLPGDSTSESVDREQHFALRLEEQLKDSRQWSLACDMTSPAIINLHLEQVKKTILLIIEALLLPTWSKRRIVPVEGAPFPERTVGAFFHSLITDPKAIRTSIMEIQWDKEEKDAADTMVEQVLRVLFRLFLPSDLQLLLVRIDLGNLLLCVPAMEDIEDDDPSKNCGLLLHQSEIVFRFYPSSGTRKSNLLDVLACKGVAWSSLIESQEDGFYQKISSRQSLLSVVPHDSSATEVLVNPFDIALSYAAARIAFSMDNELLVDDIRKVEEFIWQLLAFRDTCKAFESELTGIFSAIGSSGPEMEQRTDSPDTGRGKIDIRSSHEPILASIRSGRRFIYKLQEELGSHDLQLRNTLREKEAQVNALQRLVFQKEKERFGALGLMSSKVAGWLRMGGLHQAGARVGKVSTMWTYWAVLRKSILLLYISPGEPKPVDVVALEGAQLRDLAGGRSKQDVKRGFAIVESSGVTRFFVTFSGPLFGLWTRKIQQAIGVSSVHLEGAGRFTDEGAEGPEEAELSVRTPESIRERSLSEVESGNSRRRIGIGGRLAAATKNKIGSAFETARLKGLEVTERRRLNKQDSTEPYDGSYEVYDASNCEREVSVGQDDFDDAQVTGLLPNTPDSNNVELGGVSEHGQDESRTFSLEANVQSTVSPVAEESNQLLVEHSESTPIAQGTGSAVDQTEQDGTVVPGEAATREVDEGGGDETENEVDGAPGPRRRLQFGMKLSGVGQATKSRIGSALQTARQKGAAVTERRRSDTDDSFDELAQNSNDVSEDRSSRPDGSEVPRKDEQMASSGALRVSSEDDNFAAADQNDDAEGSAGPKPRFGGKLAGVGQVTKSRIGSAIQTARQKSKEVSERRRVEDGGDNSQGRPRTRLGGLLARTSQSQNDADVVVGSNTSIPDRSATPVDGNVKYDSTDASLPWSCTACTFVNNSESLPIVIDSCEMCGCARPKNVQSQPSFAPVESDSALMDNQTTSDAKELPVLQMKPEVPQKDSENWKGDTNQNDATDKGGRVGMFGGIRNVRSYRSERQASVLQATDNRRAGRFTFRKKNSDVESLVEGEGSVKVKNIRTGDSFVSESFSEDAKSLSPLVLKRLVGDWSVLVQSGRKHRGRDTANLDGSQSMISADARSKELESSADVCPQNAVRETETVKNNIWDFRIRVIPGEATAECSPIERLCKLDDILELHAGISETVGMILPQLASETVKNGQAGDRTVLGEMSQSLALRLGLSPFDNVLVTGNILGGLLDIDESSEISKKTHEYQAEAIATFLNLTLECPLPEETLGALAMFLGISASNKNCGPIGQGNESGDELERQPPRNGDALKSEKIEANDVETATKGEESQDRPLRVAEDGTKSTTLGDGNVGISGSELPLPSHPPPPNDEPTRLHGLLSACETELIRAENHEMILKSSSSSKLRSRPESTPHDNAPQRLPAMYEPLLPQSVTEHFHDAMHEALMQVMEERDEAHAHLIASNVLHIHELEQERKKSDRLAKKLELAEARFRATPDLPPIFMGLNLGLGEKPRRVAEAKLQSFEEQAKQDSDAELLTLCQQLAGEISAKTAAALEIIRLKESRDIERKNEAMEKQSLKDELKRLRRELAAERQKKNPSDQQENNE